MLQLPGTRTIILIEHLSLNCRPKQLTKIASLSIEIFSFFSFFLRNASTKESTPCWCMAFQRFAGMFHKVKCWSDYLTAVVDDAVLCCAVVAGCGSNCSHWLMLGQVIYDNEILQSCRDWVLCSFLSLLVVLVKSLLKYDFEYKLAFKEKCKFHF